EFSDFQCPFCARVQPTLHQLMDEYGPKKLRVVYKHKPLPFHKDALPAALVSQAVLTQLGDAAFFEFAARLYREQRQLDSDSLVMRAAEAGLDPRILKRLLESEEPQRQVDADMALADKIGVSGTPAFRINGVTLSGAQSIERFREVIDAELIATRGLGVADTQVYAKRVTANYEAPKPRPQRAEPEDKTVWKVPVGTSPTLGPKDALVTIVVFSDFQCPFCKRVEPTLDRIRKQYGDDVRMVFKHHPLPFHARAEPAANLAVEAYKQKGNKGFWLVHDLLFESQPQLADDDLLGIAKQAGLNPVRAKQAITKSLHKKSIEADQDLADDVHARGTPHFFVNGRRVSGAQPFESFEKVIDERIATAKAAIGPTLPRGKYYDHLMKDAKHGDPFIVKQVAAPTSANPTKGPKTGIRIHIFSDLQCPFCRRVNPTLAQVEKDFKNQVQFIWHNLPLPFHKDAEPAAEAAMEVFKQKGAKAFWHFIDAVFDAQATGIGRDVLEQLAAREGVNMQQFTDALDQHTHLTSIRAEKAAADQLGINGTPGFVVGGYFISGAQPYSKFKRAIKRAQKDKQAGRKPQAAN
ncbi:MAG: thioredoxin domain-containing protein, partial [Myxococcales bacterium]|nr:thioredoxin domain-containing protein [Myxococcales bacterium]